MRSQHHLFAAVATILSAPLIGLIASVPLEALGGRPNEAVDFLRSTNSLLILSVFVSWLVFCVACPLAILMVNRFGPKLRAAVPLGFVIGAVSGLLVLGRDPAQSAIIEAGIVGGIMGGLYCLFLREIHKRLTRRNQTA